MEKQGNLRVRGELVVIVDDDAAVRKSLKFSLEVEGFVVRTYERAEELLSETILPTCRCLVIDQKLPGLSGIDLIAKLRERKVSVPVILITTHPSAALVRRAKIESVPIIEKPLLGSDLLDGINEIMMRPTSSPN